MKHQTMHTSHSKSLMTVYTSFLSLLSLVFSLIGIKLVLVTIWLIRLLTLAMYLDWVLRKSFAAEITTEMFFSSLFLFLPSPFSLLILFFLLFILLFILKQRINLKLSKTIVESRRNCSSHHWPRLTSVPAFGPDTSIPEPWARQFAGRSPGG